MVLSPQKIAQLENYQILDRKLPNLCADRLDYTFREFNYFSSRKNLKTCLKSLKVYNNEIVFDNFRAAKIFGKTYLTCHLKHWQAFQTIARYHLMSNILKQALKEQIITKEDFLTDDNAIIGKILKSKNKKLISNLKDFTKKNFKPRVKDWKKIKKKLRYVDPKFIENNKIYSLSQRDQRFKKSIRGFIN